MNSLYVYTLRVEAFFVDSLFVALLPVGPRDGAGVFAADIVSLTDNLLLVLPASSWESLSLYWRDGGRLDAAPCSERSGMLTPLWEDEEILVLRPCWEGGGRASSSCEDACLLVPRLEGVCLFLRSWREEGLTMSLVENGSLDIGAKRVVEAL